ncbi:pyridoxamine 5'-phosphate oxidase [Mycolicibacterium aromaticivorans JS19b1 = JCM 16368]|uniref:Pyridoxamine 5'-phosphate oxidase n=1 Tax=Mycolicibacterium aromaticivorans JS19b1 = JCM 16368 TaxID=1440774 RepID=A0A064CEG7_9MYCO|nr:pyridoxamine 5'-phosphate oxidase [Mycolicibacterium aromaticivorans JS19b1 = JCM 16368]
MAGVDSKGGVQVVAVTSPPVTFGKVLGYLRGHHFAVLSSSDVAGVPASAGVTYGTSESALVIYVMTRRHLQKARNIAANPQVSVVVPLTRRLMWFLPPPTVQLRGHAELLDWTDEEGTRVFQRFWLGRRILRAYREFHRRGEQRICFIRITPDPAIHTYLVGSSVWQVRRRMESGAATVVQPAVVD